MHSTALRSASPVAGLRSSCGGFRSSDSRTHVSSRSPPTRWSIMSVQQAFSIYFDDPWGHLLEVTTYDYGEIAAWLKARQ